MAVAATSGMNSAVRPMSREERKVILASSLGTVFEWYDFYLYGSLATIIGAQFFSAFDVTTRNIFALLAFAAGFFVRPFGALVFGRIGDLVGRKYTFLVTILIMGASTFLVGLLPSYNQIGWAAPIILIVLRMAQGLALGGEYGGAAVYVAEHAPVGRRGFYTSWIQTTATIGLLLSLVVILGLRFAMGEVGFQTGAGYPIAGWRIPFLLSIVLLGVSVWIRLQMNESPAFQKMKEEGTQSKAPLSEAFGQWRNGKLVLIALFGLVVGQAVVWYTGQFYALFFLQGILKVDLFTSNVLIAWSLILGTGGFLLFGALSDKVGRKPIILGGCLIAAITYFPLFTALTSVANPTLSRALDTAKVLVTSDPAQCGNMFDPVGIRSFTAPCDVARDALARAAIKYEFVPAPAGSVAKVTFNGEEVAIPPARPAAIAAFNAASVKVGYPRSTPPRTVLRTPGGTCDGACATARQKLTDAKLAFETDTSGSGAPQLLVGTQPIALDGNVAGDVATTRSVLTVTEGVVSVHGFFSALGDPAALKAIAILTVMVLYVTAVYGPIAAALVEFFPTRIRYTAMSLPYHIGNGWFGGFLPTTAFAMVAATGDIYYGLWYPIVIAAVTFVIGMLFVRETRNVDIERLA